MFVAKTVPVTTAATELTAGIDLDQPTRIRVSARNLSVVYIGHDNTLTPATGYGVSVNESVDFTVDGDSVWAVIPSGSADVPIMVWTE